MISDGDHIISPLIAAATALVFETILLYTHVHGYTYSHFLFTIMYLIMTLTTNMTFMYME